jgi:arylsulfatase A-like enzyme
MMKNTLFIVVDCLGYKFLCKKLKNYPYLNYLFSEGTSFSQAISVASTTSPSVTSMLTGCYPFRHGIMTLSGNRLNNKIPFLPELLKKRGYKTYAEVTGPLWPELGLIRGFDNYNHRNRKEYLTTDWGKMLRNKFTSGYFGEPWFVFLHLWELHRPLHILPEYNKNKYGTPYERALKSLDRNLESLLESFLDISQTAIIFTGDHGEQVEKNFFDKQFKKLIFKACKKCFDFGLFESRRLTVYRKYHLGHGSNISDTLVNVPLLFIDKDRFPGNTEIDGQISHVDILPTLMSPVGTKKSNIQTDGQDYMPYIEKKIANAEHIAYMQACGIVLPDASKWLEGVRYRGLKYIRNRSNHKKIEWLYNISRDPEEKTSIEDEELTWTMREKLDGIKQTALQADDNNKMSARETADMAKKLKELGYM